MDLRELAVVGADVRRRRDLLLAVCVHALALIVYTALVVALFSVSNWDPLASNSGWSTLAIAVASWLWFAGGTAWLVRLVQLIRWWLQGRQGLVRRTIAFDSLLWLGPWLALLLLWKPTRRLIVPIRESPSGARAHRVRRIAFLLGLLVAVGLGVGWAVERASRAPHPKLAHVSAVAGPSLGGRRIVFSFGSRDYRDVWVLSHGRLRQLSRGVRLATGGQCYGDPGYGGSSGPCYELAEPLSVSRDGRYIAYFLQDTVAAPDTLAPALIVSRADGSRAHRVDRHLELCVPCSPLSPLSWDRGGRFIVVSASHGVQTFEGNVPEEDADTALFRLDIRSGRTIALTNPAGAETYNDFYPVVSPDGRTIAFLRSVRREPEWRSYADTVTVVYVMRADGADARRLRTPPRTYRRLWWCGKKTLCATPSNGGSAPVTYRIDLRTGLVQPLRHWPQGATDAVSPDASFAIEERQTGRHRFEILAGRMSVSGPRRLTRILVSSDANGNPFGDFSVSGP